MRVAPPEPRLAPLAERRFEHRYPGTDVSFGRGAAFALAPVLERHGVHRALLVCGPHLSRNRALVDGVVDGGGERIAGRFDGVGPHAPLPDLDAAVERYRALGCDGVVSLGGGSSHDAGATVALAARTGGAVSALLAGAPFVRLDDASATAAPTVAVPTTLSAAETTCGAGITDEATGRKHTLFGRALFASHIVLDPDVFATTPSHVLLSTGMNAVNHAVERLCSPALQPLAEPQLARAVALLVPALRRLAAAGVDDRESLAAAVVGAHLSTSVNVLGGLAHALTHQLGSRYRVEHGILSGIVLPPSIAFVEPAVPEAVARLSRLLDAEPVGCLRDLVRELGLPGQLRDVGVPRDELAAVAADVLAGFSVRHSARPVRHPDEIVALLEACW